MIVSLPFQEQVGQQRLLITGTGKMKNKDKTKEQLLAELQKLHQRVRELETAEAECGRLEKALQECEDKLKTVFNSANDEIVYTDLNGTIVDVNDKIEDIYGYKPEEVIGRSYADVGFLDPKDFQTAAQVISDIIEGKPGRLLEFETFRKDGTKVYIEVNSKLIIKEGELKGFLNIVRDITERKRIEKEFRESEEKYKTLFKGASDGIFTVKITEEGPRFVDCNPRALEMFGCNLEDIVGKSPADFSPPEQPDGMSSEEKVAEIAKAVLAGERLSFEWTNSRLDGTLFDVEVSVNRIEIGGETHLQSVSRDITERKQMEMEIRKHRDHLKELVEERTVKLKLANAQLQQEVAERILVEDKIKNLNEELEQRVKERTAELEKAYEYLKQLDKMKDAFLSSVSHELRTPLTSIRSFAEILLQYDDESPETRKEFMEIIQVESERLTRLINDFLDLSKIEAGKVVYHDDLISLDEIIRTAARSQDQLFKQKSLTLHVDLSPNLPFAFADRDRIHQVITNLLANAVKFSHEKGEIRLQAEMFEGKRSGETSQWIRVGVSDQGIGIEEKDHETIFDKFGQVSTDTLKDKPGGTGLGLSICREILAHYQGNIWVESQKGEGSTFFFTLPAVSYASRSDDEIPLSMDSEEAQSENSKTILVVDDNVNMRKLLRHHLLKRGYRVLTAAGGKQAIDLAARERIDLITLDLMMPTMGGYDLLGMLKNDPFTKKIPVIIISVVEDRQKGILLGASDHLCKPFREGELSEKVRALLGETERSILVVDDEQLVLEVLCLQLQEGGYLVETARNGDEAIERLKAHVPDLVILDVMMPGKTGYDVLNWIRKEPTTCNVPVVVMSAHPLSGEQGEFLKVESEAFVGKSEGLRSLFDRVDTILI